MNYYIQGDAANADKIKAAFEKLGFDPAGWDCDSAHSVYFTVPGDNKVKSVHISIGKIIMTHPDYKELELPVEPTFKGGDWIAGIDDEGNMATEKIVSFSRNKVLLVDTDGCHTEYPKTELNGFRPWTIADAKDGNVLALNGKPFIYSSHKYGKNYCYIDEWGQLRVNFNLVFEGNYVCPATKQERDLLFSKMREVGYEWDANKKELRKIKPHYDISNFKPFDKVLVRCSNDEEWMIEFYCKYDTLVHTSPHRDYPFMGIGDSYSQCVPFEGNEHLLGTTDMCDEQYINW